MPNPIAELHASLIGRAAATAFWSMNSRKDTTYTRAMTATHRVSSLSSDCKIRAHPRRQRPRRSDFTEVASSFEEEVVANKKPDIEELRKRRADFYTTSPEERRIRNQRAMAERVTPRRSSTVRTPSAKKPVISVREVGRSHSSERRRHRRRSRVKENDEEPEYVNVYDTRPVATKPPPLQRSKTTVTAARSRPKEARRGSEGLTRSHTERRRSRHRESDSIFKRIISVSHRPRSVDPSRSRHSRPSVTRYVNTAYLLTLY